MAKKFLIAYYSRTGNTRKASKLLAKKLRADIDEIIDEKNRQGVLGYILAGIDASLKRKTKIKYKKNPKNYSKVIIATPNWAGKPAVAIYTYLLENKSSLGKTAFLCVQGGSGGEKVIKFMEDTLGKKAFASFVINAREVDAKIQEVIKKLK